MPITSADHARTVHAVLQRKRGGRNGSRTQQHDCRVAEREHEADSDRTLAFLHQLARHIVDGRNMVGVHGVAQAEAVGEKRRSQQQRIVAKRESRPKPHWPH